MDNTCIAVLKDCLKFSLNSLKYDLAQNIISYESPPSLEYTALTRVSIALWYQDDVCDNIAKLFDLYDSVYPYSFEHVHKFHWPEIEKVVVSKVFNLILPKYCKDALEGMIISIGKQILLFLDSQYHGKLCGYEWMKKSLNQICWTYQGTINYLKTAKILTENININKEARYIIACNNCLVENIHELHGQLSDDFLHEIYGKKRYLLVLFWTLHIRGKRSEFFEFGNRVYRDTPNNEFILEWAVTNNKIVAVQYFWNNFADEELKFSLVKYAKLSINSDCTSVLYYMLLQMNDHQIQIMCEKVPSKMLKVFLDDCQWHSVFFSAAKLVLKLITKMNFMDALNILFYWKKSVFRRDQRKNIFVEVLNAFECDIKDYFRRVCSNYFLKLCSEDIEVIRLLISKANIEDRIQFMYGYGMYCCRCLLLEERLDFVEMIIREMLTTEEEIERYKKHFVRSKGFRVCKILIMAKKFETLELFWLKFDAEEVIGSLKWKFAWREGRKIMTCLKMDEEKEWFLNWSFEGHKDNLILFTEMIETQNVKQNEISQNTKSIEHENCDFWDEELNLNLFVE